MSRVEPLYPQLVDPAGVNCSNVARPIGLTTDATRAHTAEQTAGAPMVSFEGTSNPYVDYQFVDLLHTLQAPRSDAYDETCFIVMGQIKELLFNALHFEIYNAKARIAADDVPEALRMLSRAQRITRYLTDSWDVLSTITVDGFNEFRDTLGVASGQLSFMYRHVEFVLGNKSNHLAAAHANLPHVWPKMYEALHSPSMYDEVIRLLARSGHQIDADMLERDWSQPYPANASVEAAWLAVYRASETRNDLYHLGETLLALDEQFSHYRWRHFTAVARIIGDKPGTGGSAGVGWLRHVTTLRFFPELWSVRTLM